MKHSTQFMPKGHLSHGVFSQGQLQNIRSNHQVLVDQDTYLHSVINKVFFKADKQGWF
jgi:hypothetical protein